MEFSTTQRWILSGLALLILGCAAAHADISYDRVTWGSGGDTLGWASTEGVGTVSSPATGGSSGASGGYLAMHFDASLPPAVETDTMAVGAEGYIGNYGEGLWVKFAFLGYPGSTQSLYFESSAGGGSAWEYVFASSAHAWENQYIQFSESAGWNQVSGAETFSTALTAVDLIGITVQHLTGNDPFDYGLDNWQFAVPEPGTLALVLTALFSSVVTFRKRIRPQWSLLLHSLRNP